MNDGWRRFHLSLYRGCLLRPHRRQAGSHGLTTALKGGDLPVGAGLPAIGPEQSAHHSKAAAGPKNS